MDLFMTHHAHPASQPHPNVPHPHHHLTLTPSSLLHHAFLSASGSSPSASVVSCMTAASVAKHLQMIESSSSNHHHLHHGNHSSGTWLPPARYSSSDEVALHAIHALHHHHESLMMFPPQTEPSSSTSSLAIMPSSSLTSMASGSASSMTSAAASSTTQPTSTIQSRGGDNDKNPSGSFFYHSTPCLDSASTTGSNNNVCINSNNNFLDVHKGKAIRLRVKVLVPVQDHPNFNFIGKLLGPRGQSLKWLQETTLTKMAILGKGSMRDKQKEEELRQEGDPKKYAHLREDLHVEITAFAPAPEAYSRIGHALQEVKRFLVPDYYDDIRQQQLKELGIIIPEHSNDKKCSEGRTSSSSSEEGRTLSSSSSSTERSNSSSPCSKKRKNEEEEEQRYESNMIPQT